jgi:hypothetical protein
MVAGMKSEASPKQKKWKTLSEKITKVKGAGYG